jgi:hypothetical protein
MYTWTVLRVSEPVHKRAVAAAVRYQMSVETRVHQLAAGALMRGSVHKSLARYAEYKNARRLDATDAHGTEERKRAGQGRNANGQNRFLIDFDWLSGRFFDKFINE